MHIQVMYANEQCAVDELLVTDKLFQSADFALRTLYVALVDSVKSNGGQVCVR